MGIETGILYQKGFFRELISKELFWVTVIAFIIFAGLAGNSMYSNWCKVKIAKKSMEAGYSQQSLPGQTGVYWVKTVPDDKTSRKGDAGKVLEGF